MKENVNTLELTDNDKKLFSAIQKQDLVAVKELVYKALDNKESVELIIEQRSFSLKVGIRMTNWKDYEKNYQQSFSSHTKVF